MTWFKFLPGYDQLEAYFAAQAGASREHADIQHILAALLVFVLVMLVGLRARLSLSSTTDKGLVPEPGFSARNFVEVLSEILYGQMKAIIGPEAKRYFPVLGTLALFILFSNLLGLIPGFAPPTDNVNTTAVCGLFVFLYYNFHGLRANGLSHITHMANPVGRPWGWILAPLMFPIELISHLARPLSLSLRLAGNMIGDHAVLGIFVTIFPLLLPLPFYVLGFLVCIIQTGVFVLLSTVYIGLAVAHAGHDENHDGKHEETHGAGEAAHAH